MGITSAFQLSVRLLTLFSLSHHRSIEKRRLLCVILLHGNGGLGSGSRRSCSVRDALSRTPLLAAGTSPDARVRRHENQRKSNRRPLTHLLRCLHDLDPRSQSPYHHRLI
ncbi:LOW QUALITY PROTEIN: uncharacterized protein LOC18022982 [Eutrema salsugineum]|uniref:LOW QUALITY PROTEIN: uncharacterized protein LOC18022982 n=1 Tax=Eutrema salsugineum TaxID=72664 RepID=UPI000CECECA9|nr:LOW QUALITY PROTEIN: uncharacterized protein LOC18022982 [Eutrema salsugineum]